MPRHSPVRDQAPKQKQPLSQVPAVKQVAEPEPEPQPAPPKLALHVVSAERDGGKLRVTLEGPDVEQLLSPVARSMAYAKRLDNGMPNAGIEASGTYVATDEREAAAREHRNVRLWRADFIITPML